ncbi:MAG: PQQ-binding-like beta-propeller repeat protein [Sedimentisphaerales bacterium]|nr:PQQ-binding-like beta-propeller repeat protein [Sedimentisphaerales bacterium]
MNRNVRCVIVVLLLTGACRAGDWPQWRGPFQNGSSQETRLPAQWSQTENILWATDLPGPGAATPIVWSDRIFLTAAAAGGDDLVALAVDAGTGTILWQRPAGRVGQDVRRNDMASPSPATDGERVYFLYGTGSLLAYDFAGQRLWQRQLADDFGDLNNKYGYSSSPLLHDGTLFIQVLRRPEPWPHAAAKGSPFDSVLLAVEAATGATRWKHLRPTDAVGESFDAYSTPILYRRGETEQVVVIGGDFLTGHDPGSGREIWRFVYNPTHKDLWRLIPSPVPGQGLIYGVQSRGGNALFAVRGDAKGTLDWAQRVWQFDRYTPDVCTPLFYQGRLFVLDGNRKVMTCLDGQTGSTLWQGRLEVRGVLRASPTGADGKIYCISEDGEAVVLSAGEEFRILGRFDMGQGPVRSSIAAAGGRLFLRTAKRLYCIGSAGKESG